MLSKDQIAKIRRSVKRRGLGSFSLEEELIDFISCAIEDRLEDVLSFEEAFRQVILELEADEIIPMKTASGLIQRALQLHMLLNYFKIARRNLARHRANTFVNLSGLILGLGSVLIIGLYVQFENSYDDFHPDAERLYRVNSIAYFMDQPVHFSGTSLMLRQALLDEIPQIEDAIYKRSMPNNQPLKVNDKFYYDYNFSCVQESFFNLFHMPVIKGATEGFFDDPFNVLISSSFAYRLFDDQDPIGQIISVENRGKIQDLTVVGVMADLPENTHFNNQWDASDMISSMDTYMSMHDYVLSWAMDDMNDPSYVKLKPQADEAEVVRQINELLKRKAGDELNYEHYLQPVQDIHLNARGYKIQSEGDLTQLYTFVLIGLLILAVACINYVNLTTAKVTIRTKEVGVRKVLGARRKQFLSQFIIEAFLLSSGALMLALLLVGFLLPYLNSMLDLHLGFMFFDNVKLIIALLLLLVSVSLISGGFPGLYLSKFSSVNLLKSDIKVRDKRFSARKILVVLQFSISAGIIVCTIVILNQLNFVRNKELGIDKESVVYVAVPYQEMEEKAVILKDAFSGVPGVNSISMTGGPIGAGQMMVQNVEVDGAGEGGYKFTLPVDFEFANTLGMTMIDGRWFDERLPTDLDDGLVVNESFLVDFGLKDPIGKKVSRNGEEGTIIGVVKDFHFTSLHSDIAPLVLHMTRDYAWNYTHVALKLGAGNVENTIQQLEESWAEIFPYRTFEWSFLDAEIDALYRKEAVFGSVFKTFAIIAIAVSCLGLLGLVSFAVDRKSREIGIRKVLGASVTGITMLVSREFSKLVVLGFIISIPIAYLFLSGWLDSFKFRIDIGYSSFVWAGIISLLIAWITISYTSIKAAKSNPVDVLKQE